MSTQYVVKSAWPEGAQWEHYVENTENHRVAYPDWGYTTKENCERWINDPTFEDES